MSLFRPPRMSFEMISQVSEIYRQMRNLGGRLSGLESSSSAIVVRTC